MEEYPPGKMLYLLSFNSLVLSVHSASEATNVSPALMHKTLTLCAEREAEKGSANYSLLLVKFNY